MVKVGNCSLLRTAWIVCVYITLLKLLATFWAMYIIDYFWASLKFLQISRANNMKPACFH